MTAKLFRSAFLVGLGAMLLSITLFFGVLYQYFGGQILEELAAESTYLARGIDTMGRDYLEGLGTKRRLTWIAPDGNVLYDSWTDAGQMENHLTREEVQEALTLGSGTAQRWSDTLAEQTMYATRRLDDGSVIRVASAQYTVLRLLLSMIQPILLILLLAMALAGFLASRLAKSIMKPILAIDLERPEQSADYDELAPLLGRIRRQNATIQAQMAQLRHKQEEFSALTDNMSEGFLLLDHQGHVLSHNAGALRLLNATVPTEPGPFTYLALDRSGPFRETVEQALAGRKSQRMLEIEGRCCQLLVDPILRDEGCAGAVVVLLDVTDREKGEQLRREFTANVSHELKTPLTAISGIAEIMKGGLVKAEDLSGFASDIYQEAQRLIALVGDIIRLSQLDEGAPGLERTNLDLLSLAQSVGQRMTPAAQGAQVTLTVEGDSAHVCGAEPILGEMIANLVDNAIKYNRPGGSVSVTVRQRGGQSVLTVTDTGVGIPLEDQQRVFERFYRVDKSHSKSIGGTGLGLSIVKHGAAFHDAQVSLKSAVGEGTTIELVF